MHGNQHREIFPDRFSVTGYTKVPRLAWPDANSAAPLSQVSSVGVLFSPGSVPCRTVPRSIKGAAVCSPSTSTWLGAPWMMGLQLAQEVALEGSIGSSLAQIKGLHFLLGKLASPCTLHLDPPVLI
ncbi:uncharacterized [Tachysurus ichikawai]